MGASAVVAAAAYGVALTVLYVVDTVPADAAAAKGAAADVAGCVVVLTLYRLGCLRYVWGNAGAAMAVASGAVVVAVAVWVVACYGSWLVELLAMEPPLLGGCVIISGEMVRPGWAYLLHMVCSSAVLDPSVLCWCHRSPARSNVRSS